MDMDKLMYSKTCFFDAPYLKRFFMSPSLEDEDARPDFRSDHSKVIYGIMVRVTKGNMHFKKS